MDCPTINVMGTRSTDIGVHHVSVPERPPPARLRLEPGAVSACDAHWPAPGKLRYCPRIRVPASIASSAPCNA